MKIFLAALICMISCIGVEKENTLTISPLNEIKIDSILNANSGKVVLVNLWATWCIPCKEEMPDLIKLNNKLNKDNFKLILISLDEEEKIETSAMDFLKSTGADFESYYNNFDKDEDLMNYFDKEWDGAIPATFIFNKNGNRTAVLIGKKDYETFLTEVKKHL